MTRKKIAVLAAVNISVYSMIYMKGSFYGIMQEALGLSHEELGTMWSIYGLVAFFSYPIGGWIADSFSSRKMVILSLGGIIVLGFILATLPAYSWLLLIFALFGVFSILTYYPVSTRLVKSLAVPLGEGKVFGTYWSFVSVFNMLVYAAGLILLYCFPEDSALSYRGLLYAILMIAIVSLILFAKWFKTSPPVNRQPGKVLYNWTRLVRYPAVWLAGLMIFFSYMIVCTCTYITPYFTEVCGFSQRGVVWFNLIRGYALGIFAPVAAGIISDRMGSAAKMISCAALIVAGFAAMLICIPVDRIVILVLTVAIMEFVMHGLRGQVMVTLSESSLPVDLTGSAIGFAAFIGYSPDAFLYKIAGGMLDRTGTDGYPILFAGMTVCALLCALTGFLLAKKQQTMQNESSAQL